MAEKNKNSKYKIKDIEIDPVMIDYFPEGTEGWDKKYSGLKISGNPSEDVLNFYTKVITSREIGYDTPYKSLTKYSFSNDKKTGAEFIKKGVQLDYFFKIYPNYPSDNILNNLKSNPNLFLFEDGGKTYVTISNKAIDNFIYRGEDVGPTSINKGVKDIFELFDNYVSKNQRAIGFQGGVSTAINPIVSSTQFLSSNGGLWIIDKNKALKELKNDGGVSNTGETLLGFHEHIPFKYVKIFITSNTIRDQLLDKYGAENTQLFDGRPLKDVIMGLDINPKNYSNEI
jgi:hypothetical protein